MNAEPQAPVLTPLELRVEAGGRLARVAYGLALAGALVGATLIYLIAAGLSGLWRTAMLALLTPVLVVSILALWRAAYAVSVLARRRMALLESMQRDGVIGILARPQLDRWEERLQRTMLLPAGRQLRSIGPGDDATDAGQQRLRDLYLLLGQVRPSGVTLELPKRATLVLLDPDQPLVAMWDLQAYFERAEQGDDMALDALAELEAYVGNAALAAIGRAMDARSGPQ
ncbi:MAG: hypothetical protein DCC58_06010 [Chloroflexi bacterium]|nr:MAG: hypothetical protein DCC58_06010 [Chloroflexota bacterium]